jgi:eukaryotic-like serine/threonine-protein kinase
VTSERWKEVETLLERACELGDTARAEFLQTIHDDELRREVESLLQSHTVPGASLEQPDHFYSSGSFEHFSAGQIIDRYRIIREIGRGGMGAVFLAERADDQYRKQVAIKLIKRGTDTESVLRHFRNERQILAGFDHPNIARLLDGGATEDGLPYFVMEYIEGLPIDEYCNRHALSIAERLKLFREVCGAVSYAHRHLVIHRDIKRSNILITADGVPKLLDFGIAKILQEGDTPEPFATMTGMRPMTPEYASPEQVRGEAMTTASDVYSLGVVLYDLLTGQLPYRFTSQSPVDVARAITETPPTRPSTAVAEQQENQKSENASSALTGNQKSLRGDLDNIVLMALRKEPERRYQSVDQFSDDIQRHLDQRPVIARKDTMGYRASKFVRRNRTAFAAATLLLLSLIGGIIATAHEAHHARVEEVQAKAAQARAERRFNDVRNLAHTVLFDYHDAIKSLPGATKVRERLVKDALTYLDSLAAEAHGDPALQRELAAGYERVGDVRGGLRSGNLGDTAGAVDSFTKALRIREALVALKPNDARARRDLAGAHSDLGLCLMMTEAKSGAEHLKKARALLIDLSREQPADESLKDELATTLVSLGSALQRAGDVSGALEQYRAAVSIPEGLVRAKPHDKTFRLLQLTAQEGLTTALWIQHDDVNAAKAANDKTLALTQALIAEDPGNADYQQALAHVYHEGGEMRADNDPPAALECYRKGAEVEEKALTADPANSAAERVLANEYNEMAHLLSRKGDNSEALLYYNKSAEHFEKLSTAAAHPYLGSSFKAVTARAGAASMRARLGNTDFGLGECRRLTAQLHEIPDDPTNVHFRLLRAEAYEYLGYAYRDIAAASKASASQSKQYMTVARDMFRESVNISDDVRSRGGLDPDDAVEAKSVAAELAKCDAALAKKE